MKNEEKKIININEIKNNYNITNVDNSILNKIIVISSIGDYDILRDYTDIFIYDLDLAHPKIQITKINEFLNNVLNGKYEDKDIIISTNSSYIIRSIEIFASKNNIVGNVAYYLSLEDGELINCTNNIEKIYKPLALELEGLMQEFYRDNL